MARFIVLVLILVVLYLYLRTRRAAASAGSPATASAGAGAVPDGELRIGHAPFSPELLTLARRGSDLIDASISGHRAAWHIEQADRWSLSQDDGVLRFHYPDHEVSAPAQFLGSYNPERRSFLWSWANSSIEPAMQRDALAARAYGEQHGIEELTIGRFDDIGESDAVDLVGAAFVAAGCSGFYRDSRSAAIPYLTFGPTMTITPLDGGSARTVTVEVRPGATDGSVEMSLRPGDATGDDPAGGVR